MDHRRPPEDTLSDVSTLSRPQTSWIYLSALLLSLGVLIWSVNYVLVQRNVDLALASDARNSGYGFSAHYRYYVDPSTLILDLRNFTNATPFDLFRGLFQSAATLASMGRNFDSVILARSGTPIFVMTGEEFNKLGAEFSGGQNPMDMMRTVPEKLHRPTGEAAFGHWDGRMTGLQEKQMTDALEAGKAWAGDSP
jgi:hypothetical protein